MHRHRRTRRLRTPRTKRYPAARGLPCTTSTSALALSTRARTNGISHRRTRTASPQPMAKISGVHSSRASSSRSPRIMHSSTLGHSQNTLVTADLQDQILDQSRANREEERMANSHPWYNMSGPASKASVLLKSGSCQPTQATMICLKIKISKLTKHLSPATSSKLMDHWAPAEARSIWKATTCTVLCTKVISRQTIRVSQYRGIIKRRGLALCILILVLILVNEALEMSMS